MDSIKQKEKINKNPDDDVYCYPIWKSRKREREDRIRQREFPGSDDILPLLKKVGGTLIKSEEHLPQGDLNTYTKGELQKLNYKSFNSKNNAYYSWH